MDSVDLRVEPGELVGLLGPNGAGKTTTFRLLMGMERADSGRIFLDGEDITHLPLHRRGRLGLGFLAQEPSVFRKMTVADNLLAVLELMGEEDRLDELLTEFELAHLRCSMAYKLSGGERRRTEISRAMAARPKYLLLDEPFAGIDPISVAELQEMLYARCKSGDDNRSVLLILQGISELIKRIAFLQGLIGDPNAKDEGPSAEEELAKAIKQQRGETV